LVGVKTLPVTESKQKDITDISLEDEIGQ